MRYLCVHCSSLLKRLQNPVNDKTGVMPVRIVRAHPAAMIFGRCLFSSAAYAAHDYY
jgi:hypothetical protein